MGIFRYSHENALWWMPWDLTDHQSTLVQVMAWCRQATSHYLSQCWPRSPSPYGFTRPQWVKYWTIDCSSFPFPVSLCIIQIYICHISIMIPFLQVSFCVKQVSGKVKCKIFKHQSSLIWGLYFLRTHVIIEEILYFKSPAIIQFYACSLCGGYCQWITDTYQYPTVCNNRWLLISDGSNWSMR